LLGIRINSDGRIGPTQASLDKLKAHVRQHWNAQTGVKLEERILNWQRCDGYRH
jgi:hypothetical protein